MFKELNRINQKPLVFEFYTAEELWANEYTSTKMLEYHLNEDLDLASRNRTFIENSVEWIMNRFNLTPQSKIIDFGCGPGLYTSRFAEAGIDVTGVDFSRTSIQYAENFAKEHQLDVKYVHQNYLEFESDDKYDLITLIFCDFCALSPLQRAKLLEIFRRHLKPDGSIFMDVHSLNVYEKRDEIVTYEFNQMNRFWSQYDYYSFLNIFKYEDEKVTLDKYTIIEEHRTRVVYNWLQYYSLESLQNELNDNELQVVDFYSDVCGKAYSEKSDDIAVILKAR